MKRLTLGIIANEFFDKQSGRLGGFGWVARAVADTFRDNPDLGVDPIFLTEERQRGAVTEIAGIPIIAPRSGKLDYIRRLAAQRIDLMLTLDYRPSYARLIRSRPRTPLILWVHDPRTPLDLERLATLRVPGQEDVTAQGAEPIDATGFRRIVLESRILRRPVRLATHGRSLRDNVESTYAVVPQHVPHLPDPVFLPREQVTKGQTPRVLCLGRLDPVKRPWLVLDLAKRFPEVEFIMLGQAHFTGAGAWTADSSTLPPNVTLRGHVDGEEKLMYLRTSWLLLNTSIHEALPISFLEALSFESPIIASEDPDQLTSRFGLHVPRTTGTGEAALGQYEDALRELLGNHELRRGLGRAGRHWVEATHNRQTFASSFAQIARSMGLAVGDPTSVAPFPVELSQPTDPDGHRASGSQPVGARDNR